MGKAEKNSQKLEKLRWFWFIPSAAMFAGTQIPFGRGVAFCLSAVFGIAFYLLCTRGRMFIICEEIVRDMRDALDSLGQMENVFEVKSFSVGLVVRVYLIKARRMAPICNKAILDKIDRGWYKNLVWVTQVVDIEGESEVKEAQKALNESLLEGINQENGKGKRKK